MFTKTYPEGVGDGATVAAGVGVGVGVEYGYVTVGAGVLVGIGETGTVTTSTTSQILGFNGSTWVSYSPEIKGALSLKRDKNFCEV